VKLPAPIEIALRFIALAILLAVTSILLAPPDDGLSPYLSGLADLSPDAALAAGCQNKTCQFVHGRIACARSTEAMNCKAVGTCESKPCPI